MIVLRVEHRLSRMGPYRHGMCVDYRCSVDDLMDDNDKDHPIPNEEGIPQSQMHVFGFETPAHMYAWFPERVLAVLGRQPYDFVVALYDVGLVLPGSTRVFRGTKQLSFYRGRSFEQAVEVLVPPIIEFPACHDRILVEDAFEGARAKEAA